jgi:hypothetical protein
MVTKQTWRVVLADGTVHDAVIHEHRGEFWARMRPGGIGSCESTPRTAIARLVAAAAIDVAEVLAPGERSRAELTADYNRLLAATHAYLTASHRESGEATARAALVEESGWSACPCEGCAIGGECEAEAKR